MTEKPKGRTLKARTPRSDEGLRLAEAANGIGAFEYDLETNLWQCRPAVAALFGLDPMKAPADFEEWQQAIFVDDAPKLRAAIETAKESGTFYVEFRVKRSDGQLHWLAGKGQVAPAVASGG